MTSHPRRYVTFSTRTLAQTDSVELLRDEVGRHFFAVEATAGTNVSVGCGDELMLNRVHREAPDARLQWAKDGRALSANASSLGACRSPR